MASWKDGPSLVCYEGGCVTLSKLNVRSNGGHGKKPFKAGAGDNESKVTQILNYPYQHEAIYLWKIATGKQFLF